MELQTTIEQYWKNTICASEAVLGLLSAFENQGNDLINDTIKPLRKLVEKGRDFESLKSFNTKTPKSFNNNHKHYELEPNWTKENDRTICVSLGNQKCITAIAITTEAQLEAIIPEIYKSQYIAIDCEFLGIKKELPVLKLLQIAVSKEKGYAIQVDLVGVQAITRHLKPVLENDDVNLIGWAYRGDAMAIECFIKDIELGSVLDLQAKLKPVAVEELSLNSAMARYASDWEGLEAFMTIKQFRDTFSFSTYDCIWTKDPLPAKALVYSVFDVVCLVALYEATLTYPTLTEHYWPYTVTQGSNRKALDRWHRQRAIGRNSSPSQQSLISATKSPPYTPGSSRILSFSSGNSSSKNSTPIAANATLANSTDTTDDLYDDNDPQFRQDLQEAIKRSKQEYMSSAAKQDKASQDNLNWFEEEEKDMELCDSGDDWRKELNEKKSEIHFGEPSKTVSDSTVPVKSDSWDNNNTFEDANPDDLSWTKPWPYERRTDSPRSPRGSNYKSAFRQNAPRAPRSVHSPKPTFTSPRNNHTRPAIPNQNLSHFQSKPSRDRYRADLRNRVTVGDQSGEFTWGPVNKDELAEESWSHFAKESETLWDKGIDADLKDIEKISPVASPANMATATKMTVTTETDTTSAASTPPYQANKKFNTTAKTWDDPQNIPSDDWETVDERPRTMEMPMNQIPIRSRFSGPTVNNIFDDDDADEDDEDDEDTQGPAKRTEEESTTWADDAYLEDTPNSLSMHVINAPNQLDMVHIPSEPFLAAITYHVTSLDKNDAKPTVLVKALQIFIATETTGESYTIVLDQACLLKNRDKLAATKVGYLLTDPKVKRLVWFMNYIRDSLNDRLGFSLGPSIDVSYIAIADQGQQLTFHQAVDIYLKHWPDYERYCETKRVKEKASHKSFGYAPWDEKKLRSHELEYSAFGGLALYKLYKSPKSIDLADESDFVV